MNHTKIIKYIKSQFKNVVDDKIKYHEQSIKNSLIQPIKNNLTKQYNLKNPILCEYCIANSIEDFNTQLSAENSEYIKEVDHIFSYRLTVDNDYFDENIFISDDTKILPTRIKIIINDDEDNNSLAKDITDKIKIISSKRITIVAAYYTKPQAIYNNQPSFIYLTYKQ